MVYFDIVLAFIGGLGLFIYGMHVMASGLQKAAGSRMKQLLGLLTTNKLAGVLVGTAVTGIIQSSSATTVMVVGFVNAELMNLSQAVGVIMGANIGTTVTSWLVASVEWAAYLNPVKLAPLAIGIGAAMVLFAKKERFKQIGEIVVGFGILFVGMNSMSGAVKPLRESEIFRQVFVALGANPLLGILAGTVVTGIIQSSSASVGILQSLALAGLVPWNAAVYIIMGQNIGTCVTALLSSIGTSKNAKSAAYIHLLFNIIGTVIFSIVSIIYFTFINRAIGTTTITITEISVVHTSFNIACTVLIFPFSNVLITIAQKMVASKKSKADEGELAHLDDRILETPTFAIESCIMELMRMGEMAKENLETATQALLERDLEKAEQVIKRERSINSLYRAITSYLVKLCNLEITQEQRAIITTFFHMVSDIERVGDHSENIAELAQASVADEIVLSDSAKEELKEISDLAIASVVTCLEALSQRSVELAKKVLDEEEGVDVLEKRFRANHIERLTSEQCNPTSGMIFIETMSNLERVADHALNIAQTIMREKITKI